MHNRGKSFDSLQEARESLAANLSEEAQALDAAGAGSQFQQHKCCHSKHSTARLDMCVVASGQSQKSISVQSCYIALQWLCRLWCTGLASCQRWGRSSYLCLFVCLNSWKAHNDFTFNFNLIWLSKNYNVVYFIDNSDTFHHVPSRFLMIHNLCWFLGLNMATLSQLTHNSQVVSSLLRDLRDLFYLVDGSNLRARLRPHPTLGPPGPTESMRREWGEDEKRML